MMQAQPLSAASGPSERRLLSIPISAIFPPAHPRGRMSEEGIASLAESIRMYGLLNPISVRQHADGYELIAGERRLRALVRLGRHFVDAYALSVSDMDAALMAVVENLQREPLHYLEEAEAFRALIRDHKLSQQQLAQKIGRSQGMVGNRLRLLNLTHAVRSALLESNLSERHARALLALPDECRQLRALTLCRQRQWSVRQLEEHIARVGAKKGPNVKMFLRDHRMFVNTVLEAVRALNRAGIQASGRVVDGQDSIEVIVTLPKVGRTP